mmetsp:Transcript_13798/g.51480  ORF Transcript_13798/g.51480 Transcript_13798/m.51480 type:complete len:87 (+) Transcript_13798:270-530(+)|eukprot:scaffold438_cov250-Pinguiococcus_pyrenoidosus.AAC.45
MGDRWNGRRPRWLRSPATTQLLWGLSLFAIFLVPPMLGAQLAKTRAIERKKNHEHDKQRFHEELARAIVKRQHELREEGKAKSDRA